MPDALAPVIRLAPAKLNLTLAIVGRRPDGFHALHSVMAPLMLADRIAVAALPGGEDTLHVAGFEAGPVADNLALRAVAAARRAVGRSVPTPPLAIRLEKRIPVGAGLAGGSSDAAAALGAALEAWGAELDDDRRLSVAAGLGSDVPFFLVGGAALVEGRGERVTPLHGLRAGSASPAVLLVTPAVHLSTAAVFAAWATGAMAEPGVARRTSEHFASEFGSGLTTAALLERAGVLASANDLLPAAAAVYPDLLPWRRRLMRRLGRPVGLSGSGPTLWTLYASTDAATAASAEVQAAVADGSLPVTDAPPFVHVTTLALAAETGTRDDDQPSTPTSDEGGRPR